MKKILGIICTFITIQSTCLGNSINLFNDSIYTLKATIYDATGTLLGEFTLNPRDASMWSDDQMNSGTENQYASQTPYTVNWSCMQGGSYGSCTNVAAGALVTAQSCGGVQQCQASQAQTTKK